MNGFKRRLWGAIGLGSYVAVAVVGCQDGYPVAATSCDEWCEASELLNCGAIKPAQCVVGCESAGYASPRCEQALERVTRCLQAAPKDLNYCSYLVNFPCTAEQTDLYNCSSAEMNHPRPPDFAPEAGTFE